MGEPQKDVGDILLDRGALTTYQLRKAREVQKTMPADLGQIVIDLGFASEPDVLSVKALLLGLPYIDLARTQLDSGLLRLVPVEILRKHSILPIERQPGGKVLFAVTDRERSLGILAKLSQALGVTAVVGLATKQDIDRYIVRLFGEPLAG